MIKYGVYFICFSIKLYNMANGGIKFCCLLLSIILFSIIVFWANYLLRIWIIIVAITYIYSLFWKEVSDACSTWTENTSKNILFRIKLHKRIERLNRSLCAFENQEVALL
jgi:hypothetical protein